MARTVTVNTTYVKTPSLENEIALLFSTDQSESDMLFEIMPDGRTLIGFLVHDSDASDPSDNDGEGKIYTARRHATREEKQGFQEALGLDADWEPDLNLLNEADVVAMALKKIHSDPDLFLAAFKYCKQHWNYNPEVQTNAAFVDACLKTIDDITPISGFDIYTFERQAWLEGRKNGTIGNKYAVMLDVFEHGLVQYSVSGTGPQCQFDTAKGGAVWVPDQCAIDNFEDKNADLETNRNKAREYAKSCVEEYTAYVNGDCWGAVIQIYDPLTRQSEQEGETHWGLIGHDAAKKELADMFQAVDRPTGVGGSKKAHKYTETLREGKWVTTLSPTTNYGYYEHDVQGEGGGLWFEGKKLTDFDGRSCLPRDVATALLKAGYELEHNEYVGERIVVEKKQ